MKRKITFHFVATCCERSFIAVNALKLNILLITLLIFLCTYLQAQTWNAPINVTTPYSGIGGAFRSPKLLVVNGYPAMVVQAYPQNHLIFFRATDSAGTYWGSPIPIDVSGNASGDFSFQIVNGNPAVSYYNFRSGDLNYVKATGANGANWSSPITVETTGDVGKYSSLQVVNGNPAISYYDQTNRSLKYVRATNVDGSTWGAPVSVVSGITFGENTSLQVVNGNPAIAYQYFTNGTLSFVRATDVGGTAWGVPVSVHPFGGGYYCSMLIVNGNPSIAYFTGVSNGILRYIRANDVDGTSWGTSVIVDNNGDVGLYPSLQIVNNNPAISYYDYTNSRLKYSRASDVNGATWGTPLIIDALGSLSSLQIINGNPAISYASGNGIKYKRASDISGNIWATPLAFNNTGVVGFYSSLKVISGVPAISYYSILYNGLLLYVHAGDNSGTTWAAPVFAESISSAGKYGSLLEVNGNPAVAYYEEVYTPYRIKYNRASNAGGSSWPAWPASLTIDADVGSNVTDIQTSISMKIVNGNPAIVYFDNSGGSGLRYKRATDVNGAVWASPVTVKSGLATNISLQVVNGYPAIIYWDGADLKYVRATDANGITWSTPVTIDTYNPGSNWFRANYSLEIVNGNPAVCYTNGFDLKYARATDNNGTGWAAPVILDPPVLVNYYTSMQIVNGKPAISYYDEINRDLKYVRATDASGIAWATPVILDATGDVGSYNSMQIVNGSPAISYYDATQGLLRFIGSSLLIQLCPGGNSAIESDLTGSNYQWQLNTGTGFTNINDNVNYTGSNTATLQLNNIPSSWYGYQYRCVVDGSNSNIFPLRFLNTWTGAVNSAWENPLNWACGSLPDANTDVIINSGIVILNSNGNCRTLVEMSGANFTVNPGFNLTITH